MTSLMIKINNTFTGRSHQALLRLIGVEIRPRRLQPYLAVDGDDLRVWPFSPGNHGCVGRRAGLNLVRNRTTSTLTGI
jgi:hypothetical protein